MGPEVGGVRGGGPLIEPWVPVGLEAVELFEVFDEGERGDAAKAAADGAEAAGVIEQSGESGIWIHCAVVRVADGGFTLYSTA